MSPDESPPIVRKEVLVINYPKGADFLFPGGWSAFYSLPDRPNEVLKVPLPRDPYETGHQTERRIYRRLGKHRNLLAVVEMDEYGIFFERAAHGSLHEYYRNGGTATLEEKMSWCRDLAEVLDYVHQKNVRHGDLCGRNILINSARNILLCDFAGSFIDGEKAAVGAYGGYRHPDPKESRTPTIRAEIHTLGSTIYEIMTGTMPHQGLEEWEIEKLIEEGKYPDVSEVSLGDLIAKCWQGGYSSAAEVAKEISGFNSRNLGQELPRSSC